MHTSFLLKDLAVIMTIAAIAMYVCRRLRQPAIIGYLLAGLIIGPFTPPFALVSDIESIRSISELGLVFLMFSLGLEFSLPHLRQAGIPAAITAAVVVGGMLLTGSVAGHFLGWGLAPSLLLGAILSISGSTIIAKVFFDLKVTHEPFARAVFGLMICDDIVAMIMLSVVSGLGAQSANLAAATMVTFVKITFFILLFLTLGLLLVPRILAAVTALKSKELTGISALGLCFAGAYIASSFSFSIALGTFLMGAIVAASPHGDDIEEWTTPLRDMFSALFFVSAGMLVDPRSIVSNWGAVLLILVLVIAGRTFWGIVASLLAGYDQRMSVKVGISSAQIGEFSFILAAAGAAAGLAPDWLYGITVAVAMLTTLIFPYLMRNMTVIESFILRHAPPAFARLCDRYHAVLCRPAASPSTAERPTIFSKYALRMIIYITFVSGILYAGSRIADLLSALTQSQTLIAYTAVWLIACAALAPLFLAIARYFSHIVLLLVTISTQRFSRALHQQLNVRLVYHVAHVFSLSVLGGVLLAYLANWFELGAAFYASAGGFVLLCFAARAQLLVMMDFSEKMLDQIIGLASSEPVHQMTATAFREILNSSTTRWLIKENSPLAKLSLRELAVRSHTGATVISIYRDGENISNPGPDTVLSAGDIVTLFGSAKQCAKADAFFQSRL